MNPDDLCSVACDLYQSCAAIPDCVARCHAADDESAGCALQRESLAICAARQTTPITCEMDAGCDVAVANWLACRGVTVEGSCEGGLGSCACTMSDSLGNEYRWSCQPADESEERARCLCTANGTNVGVCFAPHDLACGSPAGCCAGMFFIAGIPTP